MVYDTKKIMKWSNHCWQFLHRSFALHKPTVQGARLFLQGLQDVIPCSHCRNHYRAYLQQHPVDEGTDLFQWSVDLHNDVNLRTGKPLVSVSDARRMYSPPRSRSRSRAAIVGGVVAAALLLLVVFVVVMALARPFASID